MSIRNSRGKFDYPLTFIVHPTKIQDALNHPSLYFAWRYREFPTTCCKVGHENFACVLVTGSSSKISKIDSREKENRGTKNQRADNLALFHYNHRQRGFDVVERSYLVRDRFLQPLRRLGLDLCDHVVDSISNVHLFHVGD